MSEKKQRKAPIPYEVGGMQIFVGTYKKNGRIDISYKDADMKKAFCREYVPVFTDAHSKMAAVVGEHLPSAVVMATLVKVLPTFFFPALFASYPNAKSVDIHFSLMGPYALYVIQKNLKRAKSTRDKQWRNLGHMIACWGNLPMGEIVPNRCADTLLEMTPTAASECISLLRQIFPAAMTGVSEKPDVWDNYHQPGRKKTYSPQRRIRNMLLNVPPSPRKIEMMIGRCIDYIASKVDEEKYLAVLVIICEGVQLEEVCALKLGAMLEMPGYKGHYGLQINSIVVAQGSRASKKDGYIRGQRHVIDTLHTPESRLLGVPRILADGWNKYRTNHPNYANDRFLLANPENAKRVLPPEKFLEWIELNFSDLISEHRAYVEGVAITPSFTAEDYLLAAARYLLEDCSCFSAEELRYHYGEPPKHTDARHYTGFDAPSEIVSMGEFQSLAIAKICGGLPVQSKSSKLLKIAGKPGKISHVHIEIDTDLFLRLVSEYDRALQLRMIAHGYNAQVALVEKAIQDDCMPE